MSAASRIARVPMCPCAHVSMCASAMRGSWRMVILLMLTWAHVHMGTWAFAQSTGKLRVFCEPPGCEYVLDGKHRLGDREITLMEGPHKLVFWAPERRMLDTLVMVTAGATKEMRVGLRYSEEFIAYRRAADRHRRCDRWMKYGPPVLVVAAGAWMGASMVRAVDARKDLDALASDYTTSADPAGLREMKATRIPAANDELRRARTMAYVSGGVLVLTAGATAYVRKLRRSRTAPVFEDKEKVRFDGLVWMPAANGGGTWAMGLTVPLR